MVRYCEAKTCDVDSKLTAFVSLWTLNRVHCQLEIILDFLHEIPLGANFRFVTRSTKYLPTSRDILACLPRFTFPPFKLLP